MTAALWIENWMEECKQKATRNRIWLGGGSALLQPSQWYIPSERHPNGCTGWRAGGTPAAVAKCMKKTKEV